MLQLEVLRKILAARRAGIKEIILCKSNEKDILEIKQEHLSGLAFHYVQEMSDVLKQLYQNKTQHPKDLNIKIKQEVN